MEKLKIDMNKKGELFKNMELFEGRNAKVEYDGKSFEGEVVALYTPDTEDWNKGVQPGFIIHDKDMNYKHIKIGRVEEIVSESYVLIR